MPVVAIVEATLSTRVLPLGVLLPLGRSTVLDQTVDRARSFAGAVAVCTTSESVDDPIAAHCALRGVTCVRGPALDWFCTVRRALDSRRVQPSRWFFHVAANAPLFSVPMAAALLDTAEALERDGRRVDLVTVNSARLMPGLAGRLIRRESFEAIDQTSLAAADRGAIALPLLRAPFFCAVVDVPLHLDHPGLRLSVESAADYAVLSALYGIHGEPTAETAVPTLLAMPELARLNRSAPAPRETHAR